MKRLHDVSELLLKMLSLNNPANAGKDQAEVYKVLIYDNFCKDIVAPLLRVSELRKQGITLHLQLESERQSIPDVPAIYFLQATHANMERIAQDAAKGLYESMHINFVSSAPRSALEELAAGVVKASALPRIGKIFDQYLSFIALESNLFSLGLPHAYLDLNHPAARDSQIEVSE
jgi:sec1 family domain-containing protein 1